MKNKIIAATLIVITVAGLCACENKITDNGTSSDASMSTIATAGDAAAADNLTSTEKAYATEASTTAAPLTEESTALKQIITTTKRVATTVIKTTAAQTSATVPETVKKPSTTVIKTTKAPATEPETTEKRIYDYRTEEKTYNVNLRYGVVQRKVVTEYYEKLPDGSEVLAKEEVSVEIYDRLLYHADYDDLLPAAKENAENYRSKINEVLEIINSYRKAGGLEPLKLNEKLTEIANVRAEEIAWSGNHDHTRPNYQSCFSLMSENGFETGLAGENLGWGYDSSASVCEAWKNSETHYENIMNPRFSETGIGVAADPDKDGKLCWVQHFYGE